MTEVIIAPNSERNGKRAKECLTLDELRRWLGRRWELVEPYTALAELQKPDGFVKVRLTR